MPLQLFIAFYPARDTLQGGAGGAGGVGDGCKGGGREIKRFQMVDRFVRKSFCYNVNLT